MTNMLTETIAMNIDNRKVALTYQDTSYIEKILELNKVKSTVSTDLEESIYIVLNDTLKQCHIQFYFSDYNYELNCEEYVPCIVINILLEHDENYNTECYNYTNYVDKEKLTIFLRYTTELDRLADFSNVLQTALFLANRDFSTK